MQALPGEVPGDSFASVTIMATVEPQFMGNRGYCQRTGPDGLQARRPFRLANACGHGFRRYGDEILMPQYRDGESGVVCLMRAGQRGNRQGQASVPVLIFKKEIVCTRVPMPTSHGERGARCHCRAFNLQFRVRRIGQSHQARARADDTGLFESDSRQRHFGRSFFRQQKELFMIDAERGDAASGRSIEDIRRVETPSEADFYDTGIGRSTREFQQSRRDCRLEKAGCQIGTGIQNLGQNRGKSGVVDQRSGQPDAFVVAHQMWTDRSVDAQAFSLHHRAQEGAGRAFPIGTGDVKNRRQPFLRIA